jgi:DNA-binding NarL/FixJ family response regulator
VPRGNTDGMGPRAEQLRCLIVDDSKYFRDAAARLLEHEGVAIVGVASTAAEALRRADELRPDVTLVDVHLGRESGFELAEQLHRDGADANSAVILISARREEELPYSVAASPALGFVPKSALSAEAIRHLISDSLPTIRLRSATSEEGDHR